jgi:hypothetical protein
MLKYLLSDVRICSKTGPDIKGIHDANVHEMHMRVWQARGKQREGFKDPPTDQHPLAANILKDWIHGFEVRDNGSELMLTIQNANKVLLSYVIRADPKPTSDE